jgi:hypothetical protein
LLQLVAHNDSVDKSQKVRFGMKQSARKNRVMGRVPYGYDIDTKTNTLVQKPDEAANVALIFNLYAGGMGGRKITNYLKENGIMKREGEPFSVKFITPMLRNTKYCGINIRNMYTSKVMLGKIIKNDPKDWLVQKSDNIQAIISEDLFYKCQDILNGKIITQKNIGQNPPTTAFGGLIYCGKCTEKFNSAGDGGKKYVCRARALGGLSACDNDYVSLETLEEAITNENYQYALFVRKNILATRLRDVIRKLKVKLLDVENDYVIESLERAVEKCEKERKAVETLFVLRDEDDRADLVETLESLKTRRATTVKQLEKLKRGKQEIINDIAEIQQTLDAFSQFSSMKTYTRNEIISDIAKIIAMPGGEVKVVFKAEHKLSALYAKHNELQEFLMYDDTAVSE